MPLDGIGEMVLKSAGDLLEGVLQCAIDIVEQVGAGHQVLKGWFRDSERNDELRQFSVQSLDGGDIFTDYRAEAGQLGCVRLDAAPFPSERFRCGGSGWLFPIGPGQPAG